MEKGRRSQEELEYLGKALLDERLYGGFCELLDNESAVALSVFDGKEVDIHALMIAKGKRQAFSKIKNILDALRNSAE